MNFKRYLAGVGMLWAFVAGAQTSSFTYQGQLANGDSLVSSNYDLRFTLYDGNTNLVAGPVTNAPVAVTNGLFVTTINFGSTVFGGSSRLLGIGVRSYGSTGAYTVLLPYQAITSTPYAIQSLNAANAVQLSSPLPAANISGVIAGAQLPGNVALLGANQIFVGSNVFFGPLMATNATNVLAGSFSGDGSGLSGVPAAGISGTILDSQLATNVAFANSNLMFSGVVTATNATNVLVGSFSGSGAGLIGVPANALAGTLRDTTLSANVPLFSANDNFSNSVTAVLFTGSGHGLTNVPGAFFWETVNGAVSASSNEGYIATNGLAPVVITLPASPSVGDTFRVAGVGAGGWIIAQNSGQQILAGNLAGTTGLNWTPQTGSGTHNWTGLASSSDGTKLVATCNPGQIYVSANSGVTWTAYGSSLNWLSVASSTDGSHLVATGGSGSAGYIYTSVNFGATWGLVKSLPEPCVACASSASGGNLVAVTTGSSGGIYASGTAGGTWSGPLVGGDFWTGAACSASGGNMAVCSNPSGGGYIWTSVTAGGTWTEQTGSGLHPWTAIASSADGTRLVATAAGNSTGSIFESANSGGIWSTQNVNAVNWTAVASSSDGSQLAAVYDGGSVTTDGYIYTSPNSGSIWLQRLGAPSLPWTAVACSSDGSMMAAAAYNGYIYTSGQGATTAGTAGYLSGGYQSSLEIQFVGNGLFIPLSHEGTITAY